MNFSFIAFRLRTFFWLIKALVKRYHAFLFFGFSIGFLLFLTVIFAYSFLSSRFKPAELKKIGIVGNYTPTNFPVKIQKLLSYGLTTLTPSGEATSAAASRWEVKDEGKTYVFYLNRELSWQDGKPLTAQDVNYNLKDAQILTPDDSTIQIKLSEAFSPLPVLLSQPLFREGLVGLGEYKADSLELKEDKLFSLTLIPFNRTGDLPILKYRFYPSEETAILAYKLGEIDMIEELHDLSPFINWPVKVTSKTDQEWHVVLLYNVEDDFLSEKSVRQALTYALPDFPQAERSFSPFPTSSWAYNPNIKKYESDLGLAKKLLKSEEESTKSAKKTLTISTTYEYEEPARKISDAWKNLGLDIRIEVVQSVPQIFQVFLTAQEVPVDPDQYSLWHSTQKKTNITGYKNPRIDKLLEDGRKLTDQEERRKKYFDFQKYLMDDVPAAFLYHPTSHTVSRR